MQLARLNKMQEFTAVITFILSDQFNFAPTKHMTHEEQVEQLETY
jgi:hypothetical protein